MHLRDKVIVVTGGANGIGRALCHRFAAEGARGIVVADIDIENARQTAATIGGLAVQTDAKEESEVGRLVDKAVSTFGPIDLFCSNAGITGDAGGIEVTNA